MKFDFFVYFMKKYTKFHFNSTFDSILKKNKFALKYFVKVEFGSYLSVGF